MTGHIKEFVQLLRTTTEPQATGYLAAENEDGVLGFCCLGLQSCELADVERLDVHDEGDKRVACFRTIDERGEGHLQRRLAPWPLVEYLMGEEHAQQIVERGRAHNPDYNPHAVGWDFHIDWPDDITFFNRQEDEGEEGDYEPGHCDLGTLATLNDSDFTFEQIADIVDYFGLSGVQ